MTRRPYATYVPTGSAVARAKMNYQASLFLWRCWRQAGYEPADIPDWILRPMAEAARRLEVLGVSAIYWETVP